MYFILNDQIPNFPSIHSAHEDGLLAIGGQINITFLLKAYAIGAFPWYNEEDPILWFSPATRCVLFPDKISISKSMHKLLRQNRFSFSTNRAFHQVIHACASIDRHDQNGTWIHQEIIDAYTQMHEMGHAMSVEVWEDNILAGGIYGIVKDNVFCGESMFSKVSNASKAAMIYLCRLGKFQLIDCQIPNDHLISMGAEMISRKEYETWLNPY